MAERAAPRGWRGHGRVVPTVVLGTVVAVGAVGVTAVAGHSSGASDSHAAAAPSVRTATVTRRDLSNSQTVQGHLGFGPVTELKGAGTGTLTKLPANGTTTGRGKALYRVDDRPIPVFYGDTPFFRDLKKVGVVGNDVTVLRNNLSALGYDVGHDVGHEDTARRSADRTRAQGSAFTASLASALKKWQQDMGLEPTGELKAGDVLVLPGPVRVSSVKAQVGDPVAEDILGYVAPKKVITVPVDAQQVSAIEPGDSVTVALPGRDVPGTVSAVGDPGQNDSGQNDSAQPDAGDGSTPKTDVTVLPKRASDVADLDDADVQVEFVSEIHKNVLTVPIGALLALSGGGFAVQRPDGELLRVRTGMFATGLVEISGKGLSAGLDVVVAS
ncbi:peptidoglycan-binding protein [Streptomyces sp. NPDC101175]|uniref:peptidoglycan-binding protein n=1 Tax=Streptomyces sp. NPDC101175 TaxID=3366123 RepID=UPI00383979C5